MYDDFKDFDRKFDERMASAKRWAIVAICIQLAVYVGVLGFVGWVIVKLLQHFGVV